MELEEKTKIKKDDKVVLKETSKNRNVQDFDNVKLISKLKDNPSRLQNVKESLKYFSILKKNHYLERRRYKPALDDILICNCIPCVEDQLHLRPQGPQYSYNCGDRCLNRFTCTECDVELCPCGELCKNRRFQRHEDACIYPYRCGGKGWGLAAGERIYKGQFIMQYIGEIFYTHSPLGRRRTQEYSKSTCTYLMKINNQEVIDPTYKGNLARFINHSCGPNCITVKWNVLGEVCIGIFANRDIHEDEEFNFDYQFDAYNTPLTKCLCGTISCKGYLGLKPTNITQEKWEEHLENMLCKICEIKTSQDDDKLLLCDKCNCGFHMFCLKPPIEQVPKDSWFCTECLEELRLEDEKEQEKARIECLAQRKIKAIATERDKGLRRRARRKQKKSSESISSSESSSSSKKHSDEEYHIRFKQLKHLENEATLELLQVKEQEDISIEPDRIRKKQAVAQVEPMIQEDEHIQEKILQQIQQHLQHQLQQQMQQEAQILKKKQISQFNSQQASSQDSSKKMQLQNIVEIAHQKFTKAYENNLELQQRVANLSQSLSSQENIKDCIRVNILEQKVVRKNAALMYQIGNKTSFEQVDSEQVDFFRKENDLTVLGSVSQIAVFRDVFVLIESIIKELKKELGIVEGQIKVPVLYLKRLVLIFNEQEQLHQVNILYNKQAAHMEEIFPLDRTTPIKIKGSKINIQNCVTEINKYIKLLTVYRLYISRSETKTVQQNMFYLRQNTQAEVRISRDSVYRGEHLQRDINHPFFYIQFREKEVCLIGTEKQIQETSKAITNLLEQERMKESDKEVTYFTVLVSTNYKENCKYVKSIMEKQCPSTKVLLFEASHPRKNLTILVLCLRTQIEQVREQFTELVQQHCSIKLDQFQDQMSMQMCRYVFKYLQNTMMTQEMAFMKNWDLITPYFFNYNPYKKDYSDENWFLKRCANSLVRDSETQLYIQYILGSKISEGLNEQEKNARKKNVINLMRKILSGLAFYKKNNDKERERHDQNENHYKQPERVIFNSDMFMSQSMTQVNIASEKNIKEQSYHELADNHSRLHQSSTHQQESGEDYIQKVEALPAPLVGLPQLLSEPALAKLIVQAVKSSGDVSSSNSQSFSLKSSENSKDQKASISSEKQESSSGGKESPSQHYRGHHQRPQTKKTQRYYPSPHYHHRRSNSQYSSYSRDRKKNRNLSPHKRVKHIKNKEQYKDQQYRDQQYKEHQYKDQFKDPQIKDQYKNQFKEQTNKDQYKIQYKDGYKDQQKEQYKNHNKDQYHKNFRYSSHRKFQDIQEKSKSRQHDRERDRRSQQDENVIKVRQNQSPDQQVRGYNSKYLNSRDNRYSLNLAHPSPVGIIMKDQSQLKFSRKPKILLDQSSSSRSRSRYQKKSQKQTKHR